MDRVVVGHFTSNNNDTKSENPSTQSDKPKTSFLDPGSLSLEFKSRAETVDTRHTIVESMSRRDPELRNREFFSSTRLLKMNIKKESFHGRRVRDERLP